jgi:hypothetical protein
MGMAHIAFHRSRVDSEVVFHPCQGSYSSAASGGAYKLLIPKFIHLLPLFLPVHEQYGDRWWYRHLCALGGVFNELAMVSANLVGFVIGTEGMKYMIQQLFGSWHG